MTEPEPTTPIINPALHVVPAESTDFVRHTLTDDCVCGPDMEPVKRDDGSVGWICTHHSLDGREHEEPEPQSCGQCGKSATACGRSGDFCCAGCSRTRFGTHYTTTEDHR